MKLYRNAIILVVVLAILIGAYLVLGKNKSTDSSVGATTTEETQKAEKVYKVDTDKVTQFTVQNKNGTFSFVKKGDSWDYPAGDKGFKLSSEKVDTMVFSIADVDAVEIIEKNATDLAQYGLDKPITVTIKTKDAVSVLQVGNITPSGDSYYLKLKDNNKVFSVSAYVCDSLNFSLNDITDITLFTSNADDISKLSLQKKGQLPLEAKKNELKTWRLVAPIEGEIDSDLMNKILTGLIQSTIVNYVERKAADLDKYGLKDPSYILEVETVKDKTKVLLGKEDKANGVLYARLDGSNDVFTIDASNYTFIDKPLKEFIVPLVYLQDINNVSKVVVELDGKTTVCKIDSNKSDLSSETFKVNGKDANKQDAQGHYIFKDYYEALIGVPFDTIEMGATPTGKSDFTITYSYKDGSSPVKIEYIPKDSDYYYAVKNGKYTNFLVLKKVLDDPQGVRAMYKKLMDTIK